MLHTVTGKPGRLLHMMIYKPGNLPAVGTGTHVPVDIFTKPYFLYISQKNSFPNRK